VDFGAVAARSEGIEEIRLIVAPVIEKVESWNNLFSEPLRSKFLPLLSGL